MFESGVDFSVSVQFHLQICNAIKSVFAGYPYRSTQDWTLLAEFCTMMFKKGTF